MKFHYILVDTEISLPPYSHPTEINKNNSNVNLDRHAGLGVYSSLTSKLTSPPNHELNLNEVMQLVAAETAQVF